MEKYLVIILVILLMYTVYQCFNLSMTTTEGFAEVATNVDTNNSIKTLAQLAADLQSGGGLKVPGNLHVKGTMHLEGSQSIPNNVWHTSLDGKNRIHYAENSTTFFGSLNGYQWKNKNDGPIMILNNEGALTVGGYDIVNCIRDLQERTSALERKTTILDTNTIKNNDIIHNVRLEGGKYVYGDSVGNCSRWSEWYIRKGPSGC